MALESAPRHRLGRRLAFIGSDLWFARGSRFINRRRNRSAFRRANRAESRRQWGGVAGSILGGISSGKSPLLIPYTLPANSHTMGFKSNTTKGGAGYNEMAIVDGKAGELIRIHAQKDMDTTVLNDRTTKVINNDTLVIKEGSRSQTIEKGSDSLEIKVGGRETKILNAQDKLTAKTIKYSASEKIEFICGGSSITMEPGKVTIVSPDIELNP